MVPVSMWPTWIGVTGRIYEVVAAVLSLIYLWYTIRFARIVQSPQTLQSRTYARDLLKVSVIYLPLLMAALMLDAKGRLLF
jgi:protoheme IX farnesyltransferase